MNNSSILQHCLACRSTQLKKLLTTKTMMAPKTESWSFSKCSECNLVMLNPRVGLHFLENYYQDFYLPYRGAEAWGKYAKLVENDQSKIDKKRNQIVLKHLRKSNGVVLDVGCGKPTFLKQLTSQTSVNGIGLDFSDLGWKSNPKEYQDIRLITGEPKDLDTDIKADVITMWHYLEHDYNPQKALRDLLLHTNSECRLIIEVPNHDSSTRRKYGANWAGYHTPRHTGLYDLNNIEILLKNSGWSVIDKYAHGTLDPYVLDWMSRMEERGIDWSENMEQRFVSFVAGKIIRPWYFFPKLFSQGFMTVIAKPQ